MRGGTDIRYRVSGRRGSARGVTGRARPAPSAAGRSRGPPAGRRPAGRGARPAPPPAAGVIRSRRRCSSGSPGAASTSSATVCSSAAVCPDAVPPGVRMRRATRSKYCSVPPRTVRVRPAPHQAGPLEHREVVGDVALVRAEPGRQLADRGPVGAEREQQPHPGRVAEGAQLVGVGDVEQVGVHGSSVKSELTLCQGPDQTRRPWRPPTPDRPPATRRRRRPLRRRRRRALRAPRGGRAGGHPAARARRRGRLRRPRPGIPRRGAERRPAGRRARPAPARHPPPRRGAADRGPGRLRGVLARDGAHHGRRDAPGRAAGGQRGATCRSGRCSPRRGRRGMP